MRNREKQLEYRKQYRLKNRERIAQKDNDYRRKNPEKYLGYIQKHKKKYGIIFGRALFFWSKTVRKRDNYICQICGEKAEHSHHLFYQRLFPELQINENNGIALCKLCHNEVHGKFT